MMFQYDADTGGLPKLGDRVEIVRSGNEVDGLKGTIGGWGDYAMLTALVALEQPMADGRTIVGWPVVCLKRTVSKEIELKWQKVLFDTDNINIKELASRQKPVSLHSYEKRSELDEDGFTIWYGGAKRPVDGEVVVDVKVRSGLPRSPTKAKYWPQICWLHRAVSDDMDKWDIIAYRIAK